MPIGRMKSPAAPGKALIRRIPQENLIHYPVICQKMIDQMAGLDF